jgi:hypothetical protein
LSVSWIRRTRILYIIVNFHLSWPALSVTLLILTLFVCSFLSRFSFRGMQGASILHAWIEFTSLPSLSPALVLPCTSPLSLTTMPSSSAWKLSA